MNLKKLAIAMAIGVGSIGSAHATSVGLELMLLVDVSGSVDTTEYNLQKQGYVSAFNSVAVQNAIMASQGGAIAVTYIEWSGNAQRSTRVVWSLINDAASASAFAAAINLSTRAFTGQTALQSTIGLSYLGFGTEVGGIGNGFESLRQVIDVSGDGVDNDSVGAFASPGSGRNAALAAGVDTINGLPIGGDPAVTAYYNNFVIGGANAFVDPASTFGEFGAALERKLIREIVVAVPEPGSLALAGLAMACLGTAAHRRKP